ncbi:MAG: NUDIX domain-containing protein [Microgenomates group bacterium]|jgi:8-oxo-dGTP diphosphatase
MVIVQKAVIKRGDKYLILKRSPDAVNFPGFWDFPGGKLEKGEEPFLGVEREVLEETGLKAKAVKVIAKTNIDVLNTGNPTHQFVLYESKDEGGEIILSKEHTAFRWETKEEILKLEIEPYMQVYFNDK